VTGPARALKPTSSPISRARASQVWQWIHHGVSLADGPRVTAELVRDIEREEMEKIKKAVGADFFAKGRYGDAREIFDGVALSKDFKEFLTIPAYEHID